MKRKPRQSEMLFVVRKYVKAKSAGDAIRKERSLPVHDVWIDDEWKKEQAAGLADAMGFRTVDNEI